MCKKFQLSTLYYIRQHIHTNSLINLAVDRFIFSYYDSVAIDGKAIQRLLKLTGNFHTRRVEWTGVLLEIFLFLIYLVDRSLLSFSKKLSMHILNGYF